MSILCALPLFVAASTVGPKPLPQEPAVPPHAPYVVVSERGSRWRAFADAGDTLARDSLAGVSTPLLSRSDLWVMGGFLAGTVALMPLDEAITEEFRDPGPQASTLLHRVARYANIAGSPGVLVTGVGLYAAGRLSGQSRLAQLGLYGTEAIAVSGVATALVKGVAGRARPSVNENDADGFDLNRGFRDGKDASFPSGHATAAFAAAAVVAGETGYWWPSAARYVTPAAYGGAALVALARVYSDKHWASDVLMGAGIGTLSGWAVVHFNRAHPRNVINRVLLGTSLLPDGRGGIMASWTIRTR